MNRTLSGFRKDIHFIHERGKGPNSTPLILLHGWPDSFYRFHKIIPMLIDPAAFGVGVFPHDLFPVPPRSLGERTLNIQRWVEIPHGGHFTAWEVPELVAKEIQIFFADYR